MSGGWIKLHRQIQQNPLWQDRPFDRARAWVDLLLLANFTDSTIRKRGIRVEVKRGQVALSERELSDRWGWSRGKVRRFLDELETVQQIEPQNGPQKSNVTSLIAITNYERYQVNEPQNEPENGTTNGPQTGHRMPEGTDCTPEFRPKNDKKDKGYSCSFSNFWDAYPRKVAKGQAHKAWKKLDPAPTLQGQILKALEWQRQQEDWLKDGGKFIPYPASWLNGSRWEDEQPQSSGQSDSIGYCR